MVCSICGQAGHNKRTCEKTDKGPKASCSTHYTSPSRQSGTGAQSFHQRPVIRQTTTKETLTNDNLKKINYEEALILLKEIEETRPEQFEFATECVDSLINGKNVSVRAEEKTGKRCIMEAIHLMMIRNHTSHVLPDKSDPTSIYVTALDRKDTHTQLDELTGKYGIACIVREHNKLVGEIVNILRDETNDGMFYIHLDECDFGSGDKQSLSKLYNAPELGIAEHKNKIRYITYSATPEELEYSGYDGDEVEWDKHTFIPANNYIGAKEYLEAGVYKPKKFFESDKITEHGYEIINEVRENCVNTTMSIAKRQRNVIVVRDTTKKNLGKIRSNKQELMRENECDIFIFDKNEGFAWGTSKAWAHLGRTKIKEDMNVVGYTYIPVIIFISQICTRSTEICAEGHRKISVWHDARKLSDKKAYNTLSQAIGRVKHYSQEGFPVNTIKLYCDVDILNFTLGNELETKSLVLGQRIHTEKNKQKKVIFGGYKDGFTDLSSVGDSDWDSGGDPNIGRERKGNPRFTKMDNGQWRHTCIKKVMYWGGESKFLGHAKDKRLVLEYENETSDRYMVRDAIFIDNPNYGKKEFNFKTKSTSMY